MNLKELILQSLANIIRKLTLMNLNSKYLFIKIKKEVNVLESLESLEILRNLKYIKEKSFKTILEEAIRIALKEKLTDLYTIVNNYVIKDTEQRIISNQNKNIQTTEQQTENTLAESFKSNSDALGNLTLNSEINFADYCNNTQNKQINIRTEGKKYTDKSKNTPLKSKLEKQENLFLKFSENSASDEFSSDSFFNDLQSKYSKNTNEDTAMDNHKVNETKVKTCSSLKSNDFDSYELKCSNQFELSLKALENSKNQTTVNSQKSIILNEISSISSDLSDLNCPFEVKMAAEINKKSKNSDDLSSDSNIVILPTYKSQNNGGDLSELDSKILSSLSDLTLDDFKNSVFNRNTSYFTDNSTLSFSSSVIKAKGNKKYIPGYRTAAYAILKALYLYNGSHKHLVVLRATPFTDAEFDRSQKFSAFSAFKQLEKKNLIVCNSDSKYFLTNSGLDLAKSLFLNETTVVENKNNDVTIVIDSREKKNNRDRTFFQNYFTNKNVPNCTRYLALGDFIWIRNEKLIDFIVERKQTSDFVSSISDGRYKEQKKRLISLGLTVFYLIENLKCEQTRKKFIDRCLLEIRIQGFILIETDSIQESGFILEQIDKIVREGARSEFMGYGSFLEETNKNKLKVNDLLLLSLLSVKGLNKEVAIGLARKYKTICILKAKMKEKDFKKELSEFQMNGKVIGNKIATRICELMS